MSKYDSRKELNGRLGVTENYKKGIVFDEDPDFGDKVEVTIIATGVDMMGAVPEDYFSDEREFVPVQTESAPVDVEPIVDGNCKSEPGVKNKPEGESAGLIKVISRIRSEVAKLYDALENAITDSKDDEV